MNEKFFDLKKEKQDRMINGAMKVFALNGFMRATTQFLGRIYSCKIYENDILQRNFVPCIRKEDYVLGFYDPVTEKFYPGKGTFSYGE